MTLPASGELSFDDFDALVVVTMNRVYRVHQHTLKRNSEIFADLLNQYEQAQGPLKGKKAKAQKPLLLLERSHKHPLGNWSITIGGKPGLGHNENGLGPDPIFDAYSNIFRIMYNQAPKFETGNADALLREAVLLQEVADHIKAVDTTSGPIELALSRLGQGLYRSIATAPWAWIEFARQLKSPHIFKEALVHLVGQYRQLEHDNLKKLSNPVRDLVDKKVKSVEIKKKAAELRIMGFYPETLEPSEAAIRNKTERVEYTAAVYHWMTLCFFRQWFGQMISRGFGAVGVDGGATLYRWIHYGEEAYLDADDIQEFKTTFPCSHKANKIILGHVAALKASLKQFVEQLMVNNSAYDDPESLPYLTCVPIDDGDLPWLAEAATPSDSSLAEDDDDKGNGDVDKDGDRAMSEPYSDEE